MDPFSYITTMEATTDIGQLLGQPATGIDPVLTAEGEWSAYIQLPIKEGQDFHYTCEFDSSWIILKAYGHDLTLEEQLSVVGHDLSIEPWWEESPRQITVYGGDIAEMYSGDYRENLLARARTTAVRKVFDLVGLVSTDTPDRPTTEQALLAGQPVFFKSTVDLLDWDQATWVCPGRGRVPGRPHERPRAGRHGLQRRRRDHPRSARPDDHERNPPVAIPRQLGSLPRGDRCPGKRRHRDRSRSCNHSMALAADFSRGPWLRNQ